MNKGRIILMKKKSILICIIILLLIVIGFMAFNEFHKQTLKVGNINYTLPLGCKVDGLNDLKDIIISDSENNQIFLGYYNNKNITSIVNQYCNDRINTYNQTTIQSNFTVNGVQVIKTTNSKNGANHYWFLHDEGTYTIYNWNNNTNMDNIVSTLINSIQ